MQAQRRPSGKVRHLGPARFQPLLRLDGQLAPLGDAHASLESAEAAYDVAKLLMVRHLQPGRPFEELKLHRPAAAYTSHPLWAQLTAPHCSFKEACSLLAGALAADFLQAPAAVLLRTRQPRKVARRDCGGSAGQQGAVSGSVSEEEGTACGDSEEEEEEEEEQEEQGEGGRHAGRKRRRSDSTSGDSGRRARALESVERGGKWAGLDPQSTAAGSAGVTMYLSHSDGSTHFTFHIPARYAQALAGAGSADKVPSTITVATPDGRTHTCSLHQSGKKRRWYMGRMRPVLDALRPFAEGDLLRFTPTGGGAASVALVRAAPPALLEGEGHWGGASLAAAAPAGAAAAAAPPPRGGRVPSHFATKWSGLGSDLDPTDSRRYSMALAASSLRRGEVTMPARYAAAAFGKAPVEGGEDLAVTATSAADGSTHSLVLCVRKGCPRLRRMTRLLASLGAAPGDSLCLEPAGRRAARASLVKAVPAAAAAASGGEESGEAAEGEEAAQAAEDTEKQQQQQGQRTPSSRSTPATAAGFGGSAAASLPNHAPPQHSMASLCSAADQLLAALEMQGGVAPSQTAAFRSTFAALPSHDWRQANIARLRRFVDSGDWEGAAAWMAQG